MEELDFYFNFVFNVEDNAYRKHKNDNLAKFKDLTSECEAHINSFKSLDSDKDQFKTNTLLNELTFSLNNVKSQLDAERMASEITVNQTFEFEKKIRELLKK